ncbi:dienelactone hydrolase family protein [Gordonia desulfuricans]|uniref:Dienelactone hydrolase family protein n=1 Tax=Gordonia desulfuricans TaxID=89051 RepID=A0A7K3LK35_9ACTN|nr:MULTISPECIES: dienelactone hydrolase family protein [Gordonia]EMP13233.2 dienelactone hydrolase [Gordonia sp. NB41Y]NDK88590.1 dienelactone hydrolase family protein [Gordonia desulfuricans]WLP88860.1 dienelactone hydrolase family protein [Gordonia sp. NB41Y]
MTDTRGTTITVTTPDGTAEAYLTQPVPDPDNPGGPLPGVLLIMDAIGLRPRIETMADRIASWGYVVLAPNVFYRDGDAAATSPSVEFLDDESRAEFFAGAMPRIRRLTPDLATPDLRAYVDALHARPEVSPGPIGATGYCMGGRLALLAGATLPDDVAAIGMFHTGGLVTDTSASPHLWVTDVRGEVLAVHADHDRSLPPVAIARFEHALSSAGVTHHTTVYPGARHGYTMSDTAEYNHDAAEHHFAELRKLFARTLH